MDLFDGKANNSQLFQTMSEIVHRRLKIETFRYRCTWTDLQLLIVPTILFIDELVISFKAFISYGFIWPENYCKCMWCTEHGRRFIRPTISSDRFNSIISIFIDNNAIIDLQIISVMTIFHVFQLKRFKWQFNHRRRRCNNYPFASFVMSIVSGNSILRRWWWDFHIRFLNDSTASWK